MVYLALSNFLSSDTLDIPPGTPEVVIVTVIEPDLSGTYVAQIKENRDEYASRYGEYCPISC